MEKDNKENILNIALHLFAEKGYDAVGVQLICEQSGITKPTLYYYYKNKSGILKEILKSNYEKLNSLLLNKSIYKPDIKNYYNDVYPVLISVANAYFSFAKNNREFYSMAQGAMFAPPESEMKIAVREFNAEQYNIIENMFKRMAKVHGNMKGHETIMCRTFIGMINSYIMLDINSKTEDLVHQFMHGIF